MSRKIITCKSCGEDKPHGANGLCGNCYNSGRVVVCRNCMKSNPNFGRGLCASCYHKLFPVKPIVCSACGEKRARGAGGLCRSCYQRRHPRRTVTCKACGKEKRHAAHGMCGTCHRKEVLGKQEAGVCAACECVGVIGVSGFCVSCSRRNSHYISKYNLSVFDVLFMLSVQRRRCQVCGCSLDFRTARVDHCHATGEIRGLLCNACNIAIGLLRDSHDHALSAAHYLLLHSPVEVSDGSGI